MATPTTRRRPRQLGLVFRTWGGKRRGAGRKPVVPGRVSHGPRLALASRFPVHAILKVIESLPSLRSPALRKLIQTCLCELKARGSLRVVHYSIQKHHLHLIVEAADAAALSRGVKGLSIRLAKRINAALGQRGRVSSDRYFARILKTPRQTRACLCYVINNCRRHDAQRRQARDRGWIDPCSSGAFFDGWKDGPDRPPQGRAPPTSAPHTWLLRQGWKKHGLIAVDETPGAL